MEMAWADEIKGRHLYRLQNTIEVKRSRGLNRWEEIIISRI